MKKTLIALAALGTLTVPVGIVAAQDTDGVDDTTTTTVVCDQDQIRQRLHTQDGTATGDQVGDQDRTRLRSEDCDCMYDGLGLQTRQGDGYADAPGMHRYQYQIDNHYQVENQVQDQVQNQDRVVEQSQPQMQGRWGR